MTVHTARPEHEVAYQDICKLVSKHAAKVSAMELLAIAANMVGKMVAMQDQRSVTIDVAMKTVAANIEMGNQQALAEVSATRGRA